MGNCEPWRARQSPLLAQAIEWASVDPETFTFVSDRTKVVSAPAPPVTAIKDLYLRPS